MPQRCDREAQTLEGSRCDAHAKSLRCDRRADARSGFEAWKFFGSIQTLDAPGTKRIMELASWCFDRLLRSAESLHDKWLYLQENPVRAGLVKDWRDWPYQKQGARTRRKKLRHICFASGAILHKVVRFITSAYDFVWPNHFEFRRAAVDGMRRYRAGVRIFPYRGHYAALCRQRKNAGNLSSRTGRREGLFESASQDDQRDRGRHFHFALHF